MLYRFDKDGLQFKKIGLFTIINVVLVILLSLYVSYIIGNSESKEYALDNHIIELTPQEKLVLINTLSVDTFSMDNLVIELKELNVRFPHIVLAQSILETGYFNSNIFKANNNLFGMKMANRRCKTAKGTNLGHAYYDDWKESVMDYALFQSAYLRDLKTEKSYLNYLDKNYAMGSNYDKKVVEVINKNNLRELFK